jgi:hypothetical protein
LTDFVHVSEPGKGSFVYVVGSGVRLEAVNVSSQPPINSNDIDSQKQKADYEFHLPGGSPENIEVLQTQMSIEAKQDPHTDADTEFGHTTAVASKALGSQWGVAKSVSSYLVLTLIDLAPSIQVSKARSRPIVFAPSQ